MRLFRLRARAADPSYFLGTDLDDEMAMIFARYLIEFNFIELLGVISVLHPSFKRAAAAPLGSLRALRFALRGFIRPFAPS